MDAQQNAYIRRQIATQTEDLLRALDKVAKAATHKRDTLLQGAQVMHLSGMARDATEAAEKEAERMATIRAGMMFGLTADEVEAACALGAAEYTSSGF